MLIAFKERPYRLCAGICLVNADKKVLVGQRIDSDSDAWQMPQGGIDADETAEQAAMRELLEEIGTNKARIIAQISEPLAYDLPTDLADTIWQGQYRGQQQYWFLMQFLGDDNDINLATEHPEFSAFQWVDMSDLPQYAIGFKKEVYEKIVTEFLAYL